MHGKDGRGHEPKGQGRAIIHLPPCGLRSLPASPPVPSGSTATGGGFQWGLPAAACASRMDSSVDSTQATAGWWMRQDGIMAPR